MQIRLFIAENALEKIHGQGEMIFGNEDKYVGNYHQGVRQGKGKYTWKNHDYYDGEWSNDKMNGQGTYNFSVETCIQEPLKTTAL